MAYEIFSRKERRAIPDADGSTSTLSVRMSFSSGTIRLNKAATDILRSEAVERVLLLWCEDSRRMAIRPIKKMDGRAFRVLFGKYNNAASSVIAAKRFLEHIGLRGSKKFPAQWNEDESSLEIDLGRNLSET